MKAFFLAGLAAAVPVTAAPSTFWGNDNALSTYVTARAADALGDPARAAQLFANLSRDRPEDLSLRKRAIVGAIAAGDMKLALQLSRGMPIAQTPLDLRFLLVANELRNGNDKDAAGILRTKQGIIDSSFIAPFVEAWSLAERHNPKALDALALVTPGSALASQLPEQRALIYLKLKQPTNAAPFAKIALATAGGRADRLRLALADGFLAAGDLTQALAMVEGDGPALAEGRARIAAGKPTGQAIDNGRKSFAELMIGLSLALGRLQDRGLPIAFAQIGRYANPENSAGAILLALMLEDDDRPTDALDILHGIDPADPFASQAEDAEVRMLIDSGRQPEALRRAQDIVAARPGPDAFARLGVVHVEMKNYAAASDAYGRAIQLSATAASSDEPWTLRLYRASALEESGKWEDAKAELALALKAAPDNPMLLNFLGYGKLERGEDLDAAEAMVRRASALRPDDASITDSLGWAEYKRGRLPQAIGTLQRAAQAEPSQAEIQEHLGDALFTAGRRYEARFAWRAALVNADAADKPRIQSKIDAGLTASTEAR
jgi:tetratricopeptide (TPR) repeat protein